MVYQTEEFTQDMQFPFLNLSDLTFEGIVKYAVMQTLKLQTEDIERFALSVENIESLVLDELEIAEEVEKKKRERGKEPTPTYTEQVDAKVAQLNKDYGTVEENRLKRIRELAIYKFRLIMRHIKHKMPIDMVGVL